VFTPTIPPSVGEKDDQDDDEFEDSSSKMVNVVDQPKVQPQNNQPSVQVWYPKCFHFNTLSEQSRKIAICRAVIRRRHRRNITNAVKNTIKNTIHRKRKLFGRNTEAERKDCSI
jgi:hypothetical protein